MARRPRASFGRVPDTGSITIPAPVGGLNDRDSITNMPGQDAVILTNWWPEPSKVSVRRGSFDHATGLPGLVETLALYSPPDGNAVLFAASGEELFDVTSQGPVGAAVVSGQQSSRWQSAMMTTAGGSFLYLFNGIDKPLMYDGSVWTPIDAGSTPAITGVDSTRLIDGCVFKGRMYLVERNSMSLWYLPVASIGGAAVDIPMGQIFQRGGHIVTAKTWTIDAGNGSDDHLVILTSNGEVAVFSGFDPGDASAWALIGVFYLGRPIGQRPAIKFGGDLVILCEDGIFPLGKGLLSSEVDRRVALTDKIQNSINQAVTSYRPNFGWELCLSPDNTALMLNVPADGQTGSANCQYAMNTLTGAWTKFSGWPALTWIDTEAGVFFGTNGAVRRAWTGRTDAEANIEADVLSAFNYFKAPAETKYFTLIRPHLRTTGRPGILVGLNGDYVPRDPEGTLPFFPAEEMIWGQMYWGSMYWGGSFRSATEWSTVGGMYKAAAVRMKVQNNGAQVEWAATDFVFSRGGLL